jgi:osmotically-inducible protein OsmY
VVTLSGSVRTAAEAERAVQVARQTTGVSDVRSELAVAQP